MPMSLRRVLGNTVIISITFLASSVCVDSCCCHLNSNYCIACVFYIITYGLMNTAVLYIYIYTDKITDDTRSIAS
jgi:hypothetical protein